MTSYKLRPIQPMSHTGVLENEETGDLSQVLEMSPTSGKKYVVSVEVGYLPPREVNEHFGRLRKNLEDFFGVNNFLITGTRNGQPQAQFYELVMEGSEGSEQTISPATED